MNMISTGAFLPEMDASNKQETIAEKFARVWEKKNSKVARAGGVSLMALSLAACGSSSSTTPTAASAASDDTASDDTTSDDTDDTTDNVVTTPVGQSLSLTAATTGETIVGTTGNDTYSGDKDSIDSADMIVDGSADDADVANLTDNGDLDALTLVNVETVNVTVSAVAAGTTTVDASNFTGVDTLNVARGDVEVGGSTILGSKTVVVSGVNSAKIGEVVIGAGTKDATVNQATKAGVTVDADAASGDVTIVGAGTIGAAGAGAGDTVTVTAVDSDAGTFASTEATENAKAVTVTTGAETVVIANDANGVTADAFDGEISVTGAAAKNVTIANATGGVTVSALGETGTIGTDGIVVTGIDDSGASVTTSYAGTSTKKGVIDVDGTTGSTDVATVSAVGVTTLRTNANNQVETLNLSGNGADVTFELTGSATTITATGTHAVNVAGNESQFSGKTITGVSTLDLNAGTAGAVDATKWSVSKIDLGFDNDTNANAANVIQVADGATIEITKDQTSMGVTFKASSDGDLTLIAGDDNGTSTSVGTIGVGALAANAGATATGTVTIEASIANVSGSTLTTGAKQTVKITGDEDVTFSGAVTAKAINAAESTGIIDMQGITSGVDTVDTGAGADVITVNDGATNHQVSTGGGDDTITVTATGSGAFVAGDGDDIINVDDVGSYVVTAGAGDDQVVLSGAADAILVGGDAGTDILRVDGTADVKANTNFAISGFESLDLDAALTLASGQWTNNQTIVLSSSSSNGNLTIGGTGSDTSGITIDAAGLTAASGYTGYTVTYNGTAYADEITGGKLVETINQSAGDDSYEGGDGSDTLVLAAASTDVDGSASGDATAGSIVNLGSTTIDEATVTSALSVHLGEGTTQVAVDTATFLFANATATAAGATNVFATQSLGGIENVTGGSGTDYIVGSAGDNVLGGAGGVDVIIGGDGADTITGGAGADTLTGGLGADTFNHNLATDSGDTITDFTVGTDDFILVTTGLVDNAGTGVTAANIVAGSFATLTAASAGSAGLGAGDVIIEMDGTAHAVSLDFAASTAAQIVTAVEALFAGNNFNSGTAAYVETANSEDLLFIIYEAAAQGSTTDAVIVRATGDGAADSFDGEFTVEAVLTSITADAITSAEFVA